MTYYAVMTGDDDLLRDGVPEHEIERVAQEWADRLAETVYYTESSTAAPDEDIVIPVEPRIGALLRKRVMVDHAFSAFIRGKKKVSRRVLERAAVERHGSESESECS